MSIRKSRPKVRTLDFQQLEPRQVLTALVSVDTAIVGRYVFYNDSGFDNNDASASIADDNAIAPDKVALLPGETATYDNITNYSKGINGIIIDADLANASAFSAADIVLSTGVANDLSDLAVLNVTPQISVRAGGGVEGTDRITVILPNDSVVNEYLQVRVLATGNTGLFADDVFYFGNVVGETGDSSADNVVNSLDLSLVESNTSFFLLENIENRYDFNRDRLVNAVDVGILESYTTELNTVPLITTPAAENPNTQPLGDEFFVSNVIEFNNALSQVQPGDSIVLRNGTYTDQEFEFDPDSNGTEELPITFRAETPGEVILNGASRLFISGDWLVVDGFHFDGGALSNNSIVEFRARNNSGEATNSRFTNNAITDYNPSSIDTQYFWVSLYGQNNRVDHNTFSGQNHAGVTVVVWRNDSSPDFHLIDNNHFLNRREGNANGFETIRVGTSPQSLSDSFTTIENNLFERTDGEIEIISVKAGRVNILNNTFIESSGTVTLRHGNNSVVEGNYFFGNGKGGSGGVRIIGEGHRIANNYFEGLNGRAGGAISISTGVDGPLNAHARVDNLLIANNTIVDLNFGAAIFFSEGLNSDNGAGPRTLLATNVTIVNNLISSDRAALFGGFEGNNFTYENNIAFGASLGTASGSDFIVADPLLTRGAEGTLRLTPNSPAIDAAFAGFAGGHFTPSATDFVDIDGQARDATSFDIGADEFSTAPVLDRPLTAEDVGPSFDVPIDDSTTGEPILNPGASTGEVIDSGLIVQSDEFTSALDPNGDGDVFTTVATGDAFGGTVVVAPSGSRTDLPGIQDAVLVYNLQFAEAGTYRAYYRARGFNGSSDSFYTPSDFGVDPDRTDNLSSSGNFRWERGAAFQVSSSDVGNLLEFSISKREAGAELDVIVFHRDTGLSDFELDALFD